MSDILELTQVENGVLMIGDLWDARESKRVGFNLFGNKITTNQTKNGSVGNMAIKEIMEVGPPEGISEYKFSRMKNSSDEANSFSFGAEIGCELLGGILKVGGSFDMEVGWSNGMNSEKLMQFMDLRKSAVRLRSTTQDKFLPFLEERVTTLLEEGNLPSATHVVTGIEIGGRNTSNITITQTKTGDKYKLGIGIFGEANLIVLKGRVEMNVSVGESITITNYDATIKVNSIPPITPPTSIDDFIGTPEKPDTVSKDFKEQLDAQNWFGYWKHLNQDNDLIGVPIIFKLQPIHRIFKPDPGSDPQLPPPIEETLKNLANVLALLRDFLGPEYVKRVMIGLKLRALKILSEPMHLVTIRVTEIQASLNEWAIQQRSEILTTYVEFKKVYFGSGSTSFNGILDAVDDFKERVEQWENRMNNKCAEIEGQVILHIETADEEIKAVLVVENDDDDDDDAQIREESSPLVYFTGQAELNSFLRAQRTSKLLFRAKQDAPTDPSIPQRLYAMSHTLGTLYIQPSIAYPTLTAKESHLRWIEDEMLSLTTPTGKITFNRDDEKGAQFFLNILFAICALSESSNLYAGINHLYQTYFEFHGLRLDVKDTRDSIPILSMLRERFESFVIAYSQYEMKEKVKATDGLNLVMSVDGPQSARHAVQLLLWLGQEDFGYPVITGTFELEIEFDEVPPLFLAWEGLIRGVCLDHLDVLVLLYLIKKGGENLMTEIDKYLPLLGEYTNPICSKKKAQYAGHVRTIQTRGKDLEDPTPDTSEYSPLLELVTGRLNLPTGSIKFLDALTNYAWILLGKEHYKIGRIGQGWDESKFPGQYLEPVPWDLIAQNLSSYWGPEFEEEEPTQDRYGYYSVVKNLVSPFTMYALDIPPVGLDEVHEGEDEDGRAKDDEEVVPDTEEQYKIIKEALLDRFPDQMDKLKKALEGIKGITHLPSESSAKLYLAALSAELARLEEEDDKLAVVSILSQAVDQMTQKSRVSEEFCHDAMNFALLKGIPQEQSKESPAEIYPPEVLERIQNYFKHKRYYHIAGDLVDNTKYKFQFPELTDFHLEMYRLTSLSDWLNLIRLIESMSKSMHSNERLMRAIWQNSKFVLLIETNIGNEFVLRALAKAYVQNGRVPRYIPRDIAIKILGVDLSPEGNPLGFYPVWNSSEKLLKSLQVLWVSNTVPENFGKYLLLNTLRKDEVTYRTLEKVNALWFWRNKTVKRNERRAVSGYFEEPWDLDTILKTIELLSSVSSKKIKQIIIPTSVKWDNSNYKIMPNSGDRDEISILDYLLVKKSPLLEPPEAKSFLYYLKQSKWLAPQLQNPFSFPNRVDFITEMLSLCEFPVQHEVASLLKTNFYSTNALPLVVQNIRAEQGRYISLTEGILPNGKLPKIITCIRVGDHYYGKSSFINIICTRNPAVFASRSEHCLPKYLLGFSECFGLSSETANAEFWSHLKTREEEFILINLHGDALSLSEHLQHLRHVSSSFIVFWSRQNKSFEEIQRKLEKLRSHVTPNHLYIHLYIDPTQDVEERISPKQILSTNKNLHNVTNMVHAFKQALLRRPRKKIAIDIPPFIEQPVKHPKAVKLWDWIKKNSVYKVRSSLVLQKRGVQTNLEEYLDNNPIYSELLVSSADTMNDSSFLQILQDLDELLRPSQTEMYMQAYQVMKDNVSKRDERDERNERDERDDELLLSYIQNNAASRQLCVTELVTELCKVWERSPSLIPDLSNPVPKFTELFVNCNTLSIPCIPEKTFFTERWSQDFISLLAEDKVFVLISLGIDGFKADKLFEAMFGPSFASSYTTSWAGCSMRLLHLAQEIQGVKSILLIQGRTLCQASLGKLQRNRERDQQISTFLISISNLVLCFDMNLENKHYKGVIETAMLALNKVDVQIRTPHILWVGTGDASPNEETFKPWLQQLREALSSWIDYDQLSTLGERFMSQAVTEWGCVDLGQDTLAILSDKIIDYISKQAGDCPELPDFLRGLGPSWDHIRDNILFPNPDFEYEEASKRFRQHLYDLLDLVDVAFDFHTQDFIQRIFYEMANIVNSWQNGDYGQVNVVTKKEILWKNVSAAVQAIFDTCTLSGLEDVNNPESQCSFCKAYEEKLKEIQNEWIDYEPHITKLQLQRTVESYVKWEKWHYTGLAGQTMIAMELRLLNQIEDPYEIDWEPDLTKEQSLSLQRRVVPCVRRIEQDVNFCFPGIEIDWRKWEGRDGYEFIWEEPAFEGGEKLGVEQATIVEKTMRDLLKHLIDFSGSSGIYMKGLVRQMEVNLTAQIANWEQGVLHRRIINSFRLDLNSHTIWKLVQVFGRSEETWKKENDPLYVWQGQQ